MLHIQENSSSRRKLTRRQFLRDAGLLIGGAALSQTAVAAACGSPETTLSTTTNPGTTPPATNTIPGTTPPTTSATNTLPGTTTPGGTTAVPGDTYVPPAERPVLKLTPGCTTYVAFDRLYSIEHTWVKQLGNNRAVIGMTDKMQLLMGGAWHIITFPKAGETYPANTSFSDLEGLKMSVSVINPVSIKVLEANQELLANSALLNTDPYVKGWMMYVELTNPSEVKNLISPDQYMKLQIPA